MKHNKALLSLLLLLGACTTATPQKEAPLERANAPTGELERTLASEEQEAPVLDLDTSLYSDYFTVNTGGKKIRYRMDFRFNTDIDKEHLRTRAQAAFQHAIAKTLTLTEKSVVGENKPESLPSKMKKNLMEEILSEFVYTLYVFKIINGVIQVDMSFFPENDSPYDWDNEFDSNHLVRFQENNRLLSKWEESESLTETKRFAAALNNEAVKNTKTPDGYRYLGGSMSLWIKIVDMKWNPFDKLVPEPKKNAIKGFIRYRKYFASEGFKKTISCGAGVQGELKLVTGKEDPQATQFLTVDVYKKFNLAKILPQTDSLELYYGLLLPSNKGRSDMLPKKNSILGEPVKTGELQAITNHPGYPAGKMKHRIGLLTYNAETKNFDMKRSSIRSERTESYFPQDGQGSTNDPYFAAYELTKECKNAFIDELKLKRFLSTLE